METPQSTESLRVVNQFDTASEAQRYSNEFNTRRQQRSKNSLLAALQQVPEGSSVLDLPCGSGRLISLLLAQGYRYRGADVSSHMVEAARAKWLELQQVMNVDTAVQFDVEDIMALSYADNEFDAVIANRLFHHYTLRATRITALKELARVSRGPIIVFFTNTWTLRGLNFHARQLFEKSKKRTPISLTEFRRNGAAAGLKLTENYPTRGRFNKEWYAVFNPL
jgi:ubiquinone/menaquinone biosynthesis C-methylase UbiE